MARVNAFVAMCGRAAREHWCWKIGCGTCGHANFRCGFAELAEGKHPDDEEWLSGQKLSNADFRQLYERSERELRDRSIQRALTGVLAAAPLQEIAAVSKLPDWLGYLGLGLFHTEAVEPTDLKLTRTWIPQFMPMLPLEGRARESLRAIMDDPQGVLTWQHMEAVEADLWRPLGP